MRPCYLVTGATDGIGRATAMALAREDATVILHGRNEAKLSDALSEARRMNPDADVHGLRADFASLGDVVALTVQVQERFPQLTCLVNNAGHITDRWQTSQDGYELTFAVNYLAPFLLTNRLISVLRQNAPARIVNVASTALGGGQLDLGNRSLERQFSGWQAYANTKLMNAFFSAELARRLEGTGVVSNALCPGLIDTNFFHTNSVFAGGAYERLKPGMRSAEEGALMPLYLATSPEVARISGEFFIRQGRDGRRTMPLDISPDVARELWERTAELVQARMDT